MTDLPPDVFHHAQTLKRSDSRPTLAESVEEINEAERQRVEDDDDAHAHSYDVSEFEDATRYELHADYYREANDEFVRVVDGREANYNNETETIEFDLDRVDTSRSGVYRFEWVLIYDDADADGNVPPSDDAEQINTVPVEGYHGYRVTAPTRRSLEAEDAPNRSVGDLTVSGVIANEDGGSVTLGADPTEATQATTKGYTDAQVDGVATDLNTHMGATSAHGATGAIQGADDVDTTVEDHRLNAVHDEPQPFQTHDHAGERLIPGVVQQGTNPGDVITEVETTESVTFTAGDDRDIHLETDVTLSNASGASATEDITVELYEGADDTGTLLASETRSVTVANDASVTETFIAEDVALGAGDYHLSVSQSGTALAISETVEYTEGAEYLREETETGDLVITDHRDRVRRRYDAIENRVKYEAMDASETSIGGSAGITDPAGNNLSIDANGALNAAAVASSGETVILKESVYAPTDFTTTSSSFVEPDDWPERAVVNYSPIALDAFTNYRIQFGAYRIAETSGTADTGAEVGVGTYGTAPGDSSTPITGSVISLGAGESGFRFINEFSINMADFGEWTPIPIVRATGGGTAELAGFTNYTLLADKT